MQPAPYFTIARLLVLVAVILFFLAAFGVTLGAFGALQIIAVGLAVWAAAALAP